MEDTKTNTGVEHVQVKKTDNNVRNGLLAVIALLIIALVYFAWPKGNTETTEVKPPVEQKKENTGLTKEDIASIVASEIAKQNPNQNNSTGTIAGQQNNTNTGMFVTAAVDNFKTGNNYQINRLTDLKETMTGIAGITKEGIVYHLISAADKEKISTGDVIKVRGNFTITPGDKKQIWKNKPLYVVGDYYCYKIENLNEQPTLLEWCYPIGTTQYYLPQQLIRHQGYPVSRRLDQELMDEND